MHTQKLSAAVALHKQGNLDQAEALYLDLLKTDPHNADALQYLGMLHAQRGQTDAAIAYLQQALAIAPQHFAALSNLGMMLINLQRFAPALEQFDRALQMQPDAAQLWHFRGNALLALQRPADACESYRRALTIDPKLVEAHINLATTLRALGQLDDAAASFRRALEIMPDFAELHSNLAITLGSLGQLEAAVASYRRALEIKPDFAEVHNNLGSALKDLGQFDDAAASFRRALAIKPDFAEAHNNLGNVLIDLGQIHSAAENFRRALKIKPDYAEAHNNLGNVMIDLGQLDDAVTSFRQALEIKPNYAMAHYNLGNTLSNLGQMDKAIAAYQHTYTADPGNLGLDAAVWLAVLYYLKGDIEQCQRMLIDSQPIMTTADNKHDVARTYRGYLFQLMSYFARINSSNVQAEKLDRLYVLGESNCLAAHGVAVCYKQKKMRCSSEWIVGCKQWHLGNDKENQYKRKFETVMAMLPGQSTVLLMFGGIDCRTDEGIIVAWKKSPTKSLAEIAQATVSVYVAYVSKINAQYRHRLIVRGVPATNIPLNTLSHEAAEQLVNVIRLFNAVLKKEALAAGMDFLDVYALTDRGDGIASGEWHIDDYHLLPHATTEAFSKHCIYAE
jgi:tetratricopeptide (TPR) repeat protein